MLNLINYEKPIRVNGTVYANSKTAYEQLINFTGSLKIEFNWVNKPTQEQEAAPTKNEKRFNSTIIDDKTIYKVKVRQYMTKPPTTDFDFHTKYNNGIPMPMRVMVGRKLEETKGMIKMELWGKPMPTNICMVCGRTLTNKVSTLYGIGPECGSHGNINPFDTEEELNTHWNELRQKMADIKGTWWLPKSSIEEEVVINEK